MVVVIVLVLVIPLAPEQGSIVLPVHHPVIQVRYYRLLDHQEAPEEQRPFPVLIITITTTRTHRCQSQADTHLRNNNHSRIRVFRGGEVMTVLEGRPGRTKANRYRMMGSLLESLFLVIRICTKGKCWSIRRGLRAINVRSIS